MSAIIYPARRAVEHAVSVSGAIPTRLFPVLWPLWQIETLADVEDEKSYDVIDQFVVRAVREGELQSVAEIAAFLSLPIGVVERCVRFLVLIGHAELAGERVSLTPRGVRSAAEGVRYEPKESRQLILVEQYTGEALKRSYYDGGVTVLSDFRVPVERTADRCRFLPLPWAAGTAPRPDLLDALARRPDRADYNLPAQLRNLRSTSGPRQVYLPAYLVETAAHGILAYTAVGDGRDVFLEGICARIDQARDRIAAENFRDPHQIWADWLASSKHPVERPPHRRPNGVWRVTFPAQAFGKGGRPASLIGSFELRDYHFIQLWCDDRDLRTSVLCDRALRVSRIRGVATLAELHRRITPIARLLELEVPTADQLRERAATTGAAVRFDLFEAT